MCETVIFQCLNFSKVETLEADSSLSQKVEKYLCEYETQI